jgi:hypothetical protein
MLRKMHWTWLSAVVAGTLGAGCGLTSSSRPFPPDPLLLSKRPVEGKAETPAPHQLAFNPPEPPTVPDQQATARQAITPAEPPPVTAAPVSRPKELPVQEPVPQPNPLDPQTLPDEKATPRQAPAPAAPPPVAALPVSRPKEPPVQDPVPQPNPLDPQTVPDEQATSRQAPAPAAQPTVTALPVSRPKEPAANEPSPQPKETQSGVYGHAEDYSWLQGVLHRNPNGSMELRYCDHGTEDRWGGKFNLDPDSRFNAIQEGQVVYVEGWLLPETDETPLTTWNNYPTYHIRALRTVSEGK